jgi:hypothetical protein
MKNIIFLAIINISLINTIHCMEKHGRKDQNNVDEISFSRLTIDEDLDIEELTHCPHIQKLIRQKRNENKASSRSFTVSPRQLSTGVTKSTSLKNQRSSQYTQRN